MEEILTDKEIDEIIKENSMVFNCGVNNGRKEAIDEVLKVKMIDIINPEDLGKTVDDFLPILQRRYNKEVEKLKDG